MAAPPDGMPATTLVKIRMDMPWPMPRWVISSPSHMTKAVPAVMVITMSSTRGTVKFGIRSMLSPLPPPRNPPPPLWNTNASPVACMMARAMVRYRAVWVSFFWPVAPSSRHCSNLGTTTTSSWMMISAVM
jgi:hypothetical protein